MVSRCSEVTRRDDAVLVGYACRGSVEPVWLAVAAIVIGVLGMALFGVSSAYLTLTKNSGVVFEDTNADYQSVSYLNDALSLDRTVYNGSKVRVEIGQLIFNPFVRINLKGSQKYTLSFYRNGKFIDSKLVEHHNKDFQINEYGFLVEAPLSALASGYDALVITPHFDFGVKLSLEESSSIAVNQGSESVNIAGIIKRVPKGFYTLIAVKDEGNSALRKDTKNDLEAMGSNIKTLQHRGSLAAIYKDGKVLTEKISNDSGVVIKGSEVEELKTLQKKTKTEVVIRAAGYDHGNQGQIWVGGKNKSPSARGHNFVILDNNLQFVEAFNIDTFSTDRVVDYKSYKLFSIDYQNVSLGEVLARIPENFIVLISTKGEYAGNLAESTRQFFSRAGSSFADGNTGQGYVGIFKSGKLVKEKVGLGTQLLNGYEVNELKGDLLAKGMHLELMSSRDSLIPPIHINGKRVSVASSSVNLAVLDDNYDIVMKYAFDTMLKDEQQQVTILEKEKIADRQKVKANDVETALKKMRIVLKPKHYQKLMAMRDEAIARGSIKNASKEEVPAKIEYQGNKYPATVRFKGDWLDHLDKERWSYRVQLKGANTIMGMKRFSIQTPETRQRMYEWVVHQVFRDEGGMAPRYDFLPIDINDKHFGIYALEEHFGKRMIEYHGRKEGPIIKFDESKPFQSVDAFEEVLPNRIYFANYWESLENTNIDVFQSEKTLAAENLRENFRRGYALLDGYRKKQLSPSDVFDVDAYAKLVAVSDLFQTWHSVRWHNMRFYYNPINDRLEPILYDADGPDKNYSDLIFFDKEDRIGSYLFTDENFLRTYFHYLEKFSKEEYLPKFRERYQEEIRSREKLLAENDNAYHMPWHMFQRRQQQIRNTLYGGEPLNATIRQVAERSLSLSVSNDFDIPFEIGAISINGKQYAPLEGSGLLQGRAKKILFDFEVSSKALSKLHDKPISLKYRVVGTKEWRKFLVLPFKDPVDEFTLSDFVRDRDNSQLFSFLVKDEKNRVIYAKPGEWTVKQDIYIPAGYMFLVREGTQLDLVKGAKIVSLSPVQILGSDKNPIRIMSSDHSSQGFVVMQANKHRINSKDNSVLQNVEFSWLSNPNDKGWMVPGAVTFYQSDVSIFNSVFRNNLSEDGLNIVSSDYLISETTFANTYADAFDSDFSTGQIHNCQFVNSGNDSLDFSGSEVTISEVIVSSAGDKGVSAGEASKISLYNVEINGAEIGLASKDGSHLYGREIEINDAVIGLAAYQKKPEYGPAFLNLEKSFINPALSLPFIYDDRSEIVVNGEQLIMEKKKKKLLLKKIIAG